jgi:AraC family transcriptional regulator, dual regulator of chb operon
MLYICLMKKAAHPETLFTIQQESFLREIRTAVFLYLLQDDIVYAMNSFPHLQKLGLLLSATEMQSFHIHEFYEIILVTKGHLLHEVNGNHHILQPGALVFVRPYDLHRLLPVNSERTVFASLVIASSVVNEIISFLCMPTITNSLSTAPEAPHTELSPDAAREIMLRMERISNEQTVSPETSALSTRVLSAQLFAEYLLPRKRGAQSRETPPAWLRKLRGEAEEWESLKDAPQRMHRRSPCHPSHLCKSFKRCYDETPTEFINRIRLFRAARELKASDTKIAAIAAELGFDSLSHFAHS